MYNGYQGCANSHRYRSYSECSPCRVYPVEPRACYELRAVMAQQDAEILAVRMDQQARADEVQRMEVAANQARMEREQEQRRREADRRAADEHRIEREAILMAEAKHYADQQLAACKGLAQSMRSQSPLRRSAGGIEEHEYSLQMEVDKQMRQRGCLHDPCYVGSVCPMRRIDDYYRYMLNNPPSKAVGLPQTRPETERKPPASELQAVVIKNEEEENAKLAAKHVQDLADQQAKNEDLERQLSECQDRLNAIRIPEKKRPKSAAKMVIQKTRGADRWTNTFSRKTTQWDDSAQLLDSEKKLVGKGRLTRIKAKAPSKRCCGNSPDKGHNEVSCYEDQSPPTQSKQRPSTAMLSVQRSTSELARDFEIEGKCPKNYDWDKVNGGWRCKGGKHYLSAKMSTSASKRSTNASTKPVQRNLECVSINVLPSSKDNEKTVKFVTPVTEKKTSVPAGSENVARIISSSHKRAPKTNKRKEF